MLAKPYFRSCQRFRRSAGQGRDYLALWTLQSSEAFSTAEYRSDWGFFDWECYIADWSRDLFDGGEMSEAAFAVPPDGALRVVSFDGVNIERAQSARVAIMSSEPEMLWLPVIGLDRHTPLIGLAPMSGAASNTTVEISHDGGVQQATYRPISNFQQVS